MGNNLSKKLYLHPGQMEIYSDPKRFKILVAGRRFGKPLAVDTPVPTPQGFKRLGEVTVGDSVYHPSGKPVRVVGETEHFSAPSYLVITEGGNSVTAGEYHEWVATVNGVYNNYTTIELLKEIDKGAKVTLPNTHPILGFPSKLPQIPPATVGWWASNPLPVLNNPEHYLSKDEVSVLRKAIGLYLHSPQHIRAKVLEGMQAYCNRYYRPRHSADRYMFVANDLNTAEMAQELCGGLALVPSAIKHSEEEELYHFYYYKTPPAEVRLLRVFEFGEQVLKCIQVEAEDGLFLCGNYVVTHNSRLLLTDICTQSLGYKGIYDPASPPVCLLAMPTLKQARAVHWIPLCNLLEGHPLVDKVVKTDFRIILKGKRPDIVVRGTNDNDGDGLRGMKFYYAGLDEFQDIKRTVWEMVVRPALADTKGSKALLIGTPKGSGNYFYDLFHRARQLEDWGTYHKVSADNPFIPREEIENARLLLPEKVFKQEYEACWENFDGQIFTELNPQCIIEPGGISRYFDDVYLGLDWGDMNPAIVVVGRKADLYYVLETWENSSDRPVEQHLHTDIALTLCVKWNVTKSFADPSQPGRILACRRAGIPKLVAGYNRVIEGNGVINALLHQKRLFISSKEKGFYDELLSYHRAEKDGVILNKVALNQRDHRTDALRYVLASVEYKNIFKYKGEAPDRYYEPNPDSLYNQPLQMEEAIEEEEYA